jgi:hypothetical protein
MLKKINSYIKKINLKKAELGIISLLLIVSCFLSFDGLTKLNEIEVKASSNLESILISEDRGSRKDLQTISLQPKKQTSLDAISNNSKLVQTVPFKENIDDENWQLVNPYNTSKVFNLDYKLSNYSQLEIKYQKDLQKLSFVLPATSIALNDTEYKVNEVEVAKIENLSEESVIYLSDYKGLYLSNYIDGVSITFEDLQNTNIFLYSIDTTSNFLTQPKTCSVLPTTNIVDSENPLICFKESYPAELKLNNEYMLTFSLKAKDISYINASFKLGNESNINDQNLQQFNKNVKIDGSNNNTFSQFITAKNPNLNYLQFTLSAINSWQNILNLEISDLKISSLKIEQLPELTKLYSPNLLVKRNLQIDLPAGKSELTFSSNQNPEYQLNSENTFLTSCNLANFNTSNSNQLYYNQLKLDDFEEINKSTCQAYITNLVLNANFNYTLKAKINSKTTDQTKIKVNILNSNKVEKNFKPVIGENEISIKIDPKNVGTTGTTIQVLSELTNETEIKDITITRNLPKDLFNYIFFEEKTSAISDIQLISQNTSPFQSNFEVKAGEAKSFILSSTNKLLPFTSIQSNTSGVSIESYTDDNGNSVWLITCSETCGNTSLNLQNPILLLRKFALPIFLAILIVYIAMRSLWEKYKHIIIPKTLDYINNRVNQIKPASLSVWKKIVFIESYIVNRYWLLLLSVLIVLALLYLIVGLRISFVFLFLVTCLRFKIKAKITAIIGLIGILLMMLIQFIFTQPLILNNLLASKYINANNAELVGTYSYYIIGISIVLFILEYSFKTEPKSSKKNK